MIFSYLARVAALAAAFTIGLPAGAPAFADDIPTPAASSACTGIPAPRTHRAAWLVHRVSDGGRATHHVDQWFRSDGIAWVGECAYPLKPADFHALAAAVGNADDAAWKKSYRVKDDTCCEQIYTTLSIVHVLRRGSKTYSTEISSETGNRAPADFNALLAVIKRIQLP